MKKYQKNRWLVVITGPTASGKTDIAISIARWFNTEIISADSRQFYKEIPIGTAAPLPSQLKLVKHHFVGHLSIHDQYNVSKYQSEVLSLLEKLWERNNVVVMAGGSGLYINAVCNGIDELPDPDTLLRKQLENTFHEKGIAALQEQLKILDPEFYNQVDLKNPKRLMRAIEVCLQTGKKYSSLRKNRPQPRNFNILKIGLELPRNELFERINMRTGKMINAGWLQEAENVFPWRHLNALNTVGYKELFDYLQGKTDLDFAIEKIKTNTRRYAKRQITWFKKDDDIHMFSPHSVKNIIDFIEKTVLHKR